MTEAVVDTSIWVSAELGRTLDSSRLPDVLRVSVVTLAELQAGVLAAGDAASASARMRTLEAAQSTEPLPVDAAVAREWALLRVEIARAGRRVNVNVNDLWIAATARANRLAVVTQDDDFDPVADLGLVEVIKV
ncbi:PIN domain-containing protein [Georgenia subflava]|uniref:Ribonuclease VapC n=1 Tax=Georgenia subflava TaxID=1622177 RepID=A0A6N7EI82_9MICO|nr:PIN domain-containing protein [Georgenia subflava]MPV38102.1 PIN domain-containing protein [Georgenia subflava]